MLIIIGNYICIFLWRQHDFYIKIPAYHCEISLILLITSWFMPLLFSCGFFYVILFSYRFIHVELPFLYISFFISIYRYFFTHSKNFQQKTPIRRFIMNHLIGVFRIIIKIIQDFSILLPINPSIIRLPIGITSKIIHKPLSAYNFSLYYFTPSPFSISLSIISSA